MRIPRRLCVFLSCVDRDETRGMWVIAAVLCIATGPYLQVEKERGSALRNGAHTGKSTASPT